MMADFIPYAELTPEQKAMVDSTNRRDRCFAAINGYGFDKLITDQDDWLVLTELAKQGYGLDRLLDHPVAEVRLSVARQGYALDKFINDEKASVRYAVAQQGYGLDKLINDSSRIVRGAVACQGYGLDKLINDPYWEVRWEVALHGYGLDRLVDDESWTVRAAVVYQGYGLDKLATDPHGEVREAVDEALWDNDLTLEEWTAQNPDKCALPENRLHHKAPKQEKPERARSLEELAARGREKAEEHNRNLQGFLPKPEVRKR